MLRVDKAILDTDKVISKNIAFFDATERGLLSQNILAQLRNYVEYIVQKEYSQGADNLKTGVTDNTHLETQLNESYCEPVCVHKPQD